VPGRRPARATTSVVKHHPRDAQANEEKDREQNGVHLLGVSSGVVDQPGEQRHGRDGDVQAESDDKADPDERLTTEARSGPRRRRRRPIAPNMVAALKDALHRAALSESTRERRLMIPGRANWIEIAKAARR
jgi:hypothetical protein